MNNVVPFRGKFHNERLAERIMEREAREASDAFYFEELIKPILAINNAIGTPEKRELET